MNILEQAKLIQEEIVKHRRYFHQNPELGLELPKTSAYVKEQLREMGYEPVDCGQCGVVAVAGKKEGKTFLLRADMDALPLPEETDESFKSENGWMHACGHDMHTAMLLGAAKLLKDNEDALNGKVKLMFQPAEETLYGAKSMIDDGLLDNPKVDAGMMIHVCIEDSVNMGDILVPRIGTISSASDSFRIDVQGKGGHSSRPAECIDPLNVISHILIALQEILAREVLATDEVVLTIGQMHGGNAPNIIADSAFIEGSIRSFDKDVRAFVNKRLEEIATGVAKTFRAEAKLSYHAQCPSVVNDKAVCEAFLEYTREILPDKVINMPDIVGYNNAKASGSEDFSYISELIPATSCNLVVGTEKDGNLFKLHHPKATFNEEPLHIGAAVYTHMAIRWLQEN